MFKGDFPFEAVGEICKKSSFNLEKFEYDSKADFSKLKAR